MNASAIALFRREEVNNLLGIAWVNVSMAKHNDTGHRIEHLHENFSRLKSAILTLEEFTSETIDQRMMEHYHLVQSENNSKNLRETIMFMCKIRELLGIPVEEWKVPLQRFDIGHGQHTPEFFSR